MRVNQPTSANNIQPNIGVQIQENKGEGLGRASANPSVASQGQPDVGSVLRGLGTEPTPEMKQSAKILLDGGVSLDKQAVQDLKEFMGKAPGSLEQKLETVQALADKKLDVSLGQLKAIHEALHGKPLTGALNNLAQNGGASADAAMESQASSLNEKGSDFEKTVQRIREQIANSPKVNTQMAEKLGKVLYEAVQLQQSGKEGEASLLLVKALAQLGNLDSSLKLGLPVLEERAPSSRMTRSAGVAASPSELLAKLKAMVQQEPSLEQVLTKFHEQVRTLPQVNQEAVATVEKALSQAVSLQKIGWEQMGRDQVLKALGQVGDDLFVSGPMPVEANDPVSQSGSVYDDQAEMQMASFLTTKDLVVTEITQKLSQAAAHFQNTKREIVRNIENVVKVAEANRGNVVAGVGPLLESTIDMLDKAILKSDITMLTDMETEKQLMKASSDLAEARRFLAKGENSQAAAVLKGVQAKLDALNWKPSDVRIQHFATGQSIFADKVPHASRLFSQIAETAQHFQNHPPSARNTFEFVRSLGLNYESELVQSFTERHPGERGQGQGHAQENLHKNLKHALLQLAKAGEKGTTSVSGGQAVEQALQSITGQQLLSKPDAGNQPQSMFMQLPLLLQNGLENVKLYVQSKNEGQKVDWENCSLYFLIETKKLGPTGIHITAVERNLSITIKNDQPQIRERLDSIVATCKENLAEIGYNIVGVSFAKFTEQKKEEQLPAVPNAAANTTQPSESSPAVKGFDLKI
ncbi:hypothetical protein M4D70_12715 [Brevibacillus borstelensis]|uniref:hypothetical protein n=1 Tax=Brevibacillus borstelensis TaxID=45462 RepID=UPI001D0B0B2A|nr:hypothetical protein [Brevibacillus borstelensis]MCC0566460.1 hypothetical protein [Brevibacillus borstelensis]MCM3623106.1 hypothetical protein [Brevibacillus borstelensis]